MKVKVTIISEELTVKNYNSVKEMREELKNKFSNSKLSGHAKVIRYSKVNSDGSLDEPVYIKGNATDEYNYMRK